VLAESWSALISGFLSCCKKC